MSALPHAGNENFPNAGRAEQTHRMKTSVPIVEITNNADALRVWCPDGKTGSVNAINRPQLRAEFIVNFSLIAFAE